VLSPRTLTLTCFIAAMSVLTGCANIQPKIDAFEQQSKRLGVIYAQVNKVQTPEEWGYCDSSRAPSQSKQTICQPNMNAVQVSWVSKGMKTYPSLEAIPQHISPLAPGAIVAIDMTKPYGQRFVSLVSIEERETCKWEGKKNTLLESTAYKAAITGPAFLAGALMPIPAVAYIVSTRNDLGGVVCNGWNYQDAYKDKDIDSLIDIF
jgi:hypothetical protein